MSVFDIAARMVAERGVKITLSRTTRSPSASETPWLPGPPETSSYVLDGYISGDASKYADGTTVLASDLMVVASPRATLDGESVEIEPVVTDTLTIDGEVKAIKRVRPSPAAGAPALYRIFVAS